ncbi:hypothetical protein [Bacillus mycoides]|uniref:hypothetical protein n=1 Tax=Bacillus mycoides TaxID=1405 RepID=UPI0011EFAE3E|nr:hypothetical protein [Bacillus mycoides]QEL88546.1 hypothetical protein DN409_30225 [Bacillus mycoides]
MNDNQTVFNSKLALNQMAVQSNIGIKFFKTVHIFLALFVVSWMNSGIFSYVSPYVPGIMRWFIFIVWFGFALLSSKKYTRLLFNHIWPLLILCIYITILSMCTSQPNLDIYLRGIQYLMVVYSIFLYYFRRSYLKTQKLLILYLIVETVYLTCNTYLKVQDNPLLPRMLAAGNEVMPGVGSYGFFYGLVPVILLFTYLFLNFNKNKIFHLIALVFLFVILVKAAFTIAILFTIALSFLIIAIKFTKGNPYWITFIFILIAIFVFDGGLTWILYQLVSLNLPDVVQHRLYEMLDLLSGTGLSAGSDLGSRKELYSMSIDAFLNNIVTGTSFSSTVGYKIGGHSSWLDLLALLGLASMLLVVFLFKSYRYCKINLPKSFRAFVNIYWLYFICLGFINTLMFANIFTIWFLFIPIFIRRFYDSNPIQKRD